MAARILNVKSKETIAHGFEQHHDFFVSRGVKSVDLLMEVLGWFLPCVPWPAVTQMGHATQDRLMQLSDGFGVDFETRRMRGFMLRIQSVFEDGSMKRYDGSEENDFVQLKLPAGSRKKYTAMFAIVCTLQKDRDAILVALKDSLKTVNDIHIESIAWFRVSTVLPDMYMLSVTVSAPRSVYHLDVRCQEICEGVMVKLFRAAGAAAEMQLMLEYADETTVRTSSFAESGGDYWYLSGCYPPTHNYPCIIMNPADMAAFVVSDTQVISNSDLMLIDIPKQKAILKRLLGCSTTRVSPPFTQCAPDKPASLDVVTSNTSRIQHRLTTIWYSNTRNESLRRARDDVMQYHPHPGVIDGPFNVMMVPIVVIDNAADPDLSGLTFDAFCRYHSDCGIQQVDIEFDQPRRVSDLALFLAAKNKAFDDSKHVRIDRARRAVVFTLDEEFD